MYSPTGPSVSPPLRSLREEEEEEVLRPETARARRWLCGRRLRLLLELSLSLLPSPPCPGYPAVSADDRTPSDTDMAATVGFSARRPGARRATTQAPSKRQKSGRANQKESFNRNCCSTLTLRARLKRSFWGSARVKRRGIRREEPTATSLPHSPGYAHTAGENTRTNATHLHPQVIK